MKGALASHTANSTDAFEISSRPRIAQAPARMRFEHFRINENEISMFIAAYRNANEIEN